MNPATETKCIRERKELEEFVFSIPIQKFDVNLSAGFDEKQAFNDN